MFTEIAVVGSLAGIVAVVGDHENWFGNNPQKLWIWQRPPFVAAPPVARYPSMIQRSVQRTPQQQLKNAEEQMRGAQQIINGIRSAHPELATSKYQVVTA